MHIGTAYYLYNKCNKMDLVFWKKQIQFKKVQITQKANKIDAEISWICRIWLIMKLWKYN